MQATEENGFINAEEKIKSDMKQSEIPANGGIWLCDFIEAKKTPFFHDKGFFHSVAVCFWAGCDKAFDGSLQ